MDTDEDIEVYGMDLIGDTERELAVDAYKFPPSFSETMGEVEPLSSLCLRGVQKER
jgi:hypothetical protein